MYIKFLVLFSIIFPLASNSFAKEKQIKPLLEASSIESKAESKSNKEINLKDQKILQFDFEKAFLEAEKYFGLAYAWQKLKCTPKTGFICTKRACDKKNIDAFLILDKKKGLISRCEGKFCETTPAKFTQTGVFFNIQSDGPIGTLIRVLGDSRYKEITTIGLDAYIANGECENFTD